MSTAIKPSIITATYCTSDAYDVADIEQSLGISWDDVRDFSVKWRSLFIIMSDGSTLEYDPAHMDANTDWKRPSSITLYDENYDAIDEV
jgi:hypothetical protein